MMTYHTLDNVPTDEREALAADLELQAERIRLGLQWAYIPPRPKVRLEYKTCSACHGHGNRLWGLLRCAKCSGVGEVRVSDTPL